MPKFPKFSLGADFSLFQPFVFPWSWNGLRRDGGWVFLTMLEFRLRCSWAGSVNSEPSFGSIGDGASLLFFCRLSLPLPVAPFNDPSTVSPSSRTNNDTLRKHSGLCDCTFPSANPNNLCRCEMYTIYITLNA